MCACKDEHEHRGPPDGATQIIPCVFPCGRMLPRRLGTTIHAHCRVKLISKAWYFGTRNERSLVDNEGTVETARRSFEVSESEDPRIDLVIGELNRYVKVIVLQVVWECSQSVVQNAGWETM